MFSLQTREHSKDINTNTEIWYEVITTLAETLIVLSITSSLILRRRLWIKVFMALKIKLILKHISSECCDILYINTAFHLHFFHLWRLVLRTTSTSLTLKSHSNITENFFSWNTVSETNPTFPPIGIWGCNARVWMDDLSAPLLSLNTSLSSYIHTQLTVSLSARGKQTCFC